ncbi:MAG: hypothetical protein ACLFPQ_05205 [Candidatus Woesearchaeota archaeon]
MDSYKLKKIVTNWRVILLAVLLVFAAITINPNLNPEGVAIRSVRMNSSAADAGFTGPGSNVLPRQREIILSINNQPVESVANYYELVDEIPPNVTLLIETNERQYTLTTKPYINNSIVGYYDEVVTRINETVDPETNESINVTYNETVQRPIVNGTVLGTQDIGLVVDETPTSNLRLGLDLEGGTRVLLEPDGEITEEELSVIIDSLKQRLNIYGLSDIIVRSASDLSGDTFILVEIPGANQDEVRELISSQGKFEAKIANTTVFRGGEDINHVCRTADCSGLDPNQACGILQDGSGGWSCQFRFSITVSVEAAQRQADATRDLDVIIENNQEYLSEDIELYLDNNLVDSLRIGAELKGTPATDISISGGGTGNTREEATYDALQNMKRLQTILITGSLPVSLDVVKADNISPVLGEEFIRNVWFIGAFALLAVAVVVFIKYRTFKVVIPMVIIMFSELLLLLGFGALAGWSLDLAAIAGIIIAIGTGVDHQIVISDEILRGEKLSGNFSWAQKMKRAFSIIIVAYLTTVAAMFFLLTAGAGLLRGFALTTIMGVTIGILVTRPAFAAIIERLFKE